MLAAMFFFAFSGGAGILPALIQKSIKEAQFGDKKQKEKSLGQRDEVQA